MYISPTLSEQMQYTRQFVNTNVDESNGIDLGVTFHTDLEATALASSAAVGSKPSFVNVLTYKPTQHNFLLKRLRALTEEA